jgi:hypothetical protein
LLDIAHELTITPNEDHVQRYKPIKEILMIIFNIALSSFYFGYSMVYLSSIDFATIYNLFNITINYQVAQGILVACIPIGGGLGAVSSSLLLSRFSRRYILVLHPEIVSLLSMRWQLLQGSCCMFRIFSSLYLPDCFKASVQVYSALLHH